MSDVGRTERSRPAVLNASTPPPPPPPTERRRVPKQGDTLPAGLSTSGAPGPGEVSSLPGRSTAGSAATAGLFKRTTTAAPPPPPPPATASRYYNNNVYYSSPHSTVYLSTTSTTPSYLSPPATLASPAAAAFTRLPFNNATANRPTLSTVEEITKLLMHPFLNAGECLLPSRLPSLLHIPPPSL